MKLALKLLIHFGCIFILAIFLSKFINFDKDINKKIQGEHQQLDKFIFEHLQRYH